MGESKREYDRARYARLKADRLAALPPDPILGLSAEERAYIAGLIDGNGSIFVAAVGPQRHRTVYPIVCFVDSHRPAVEWMARTLAAGTVKRQRHRAQIPQYRAQLFGKRAQLLCATLLPFLKIKDRHAQLVALFPCDARIAPGIKVERSAINAERYRLRDAINALNHQPTKGEWR